MTDSAPRITSLADLRAIEAAGIERWMPFDHVFDALADVARRHPTRTALTALAHAEDEQPRRWTYVQLLDAVVRAARLLAGLAGGEEPRVALLLPPLPEAWIALWAAEAAGVAVPINHALADEHLRALLVAARADVVVTLAPGHAAGDIGTRVQRLAAGLPGLRAVLTVRGAAGDGAGVPGGGDFMIACAGQDGAAAPFESARAGGAARIAALFHTGGTTGLPKLAQHRHANQLHAAWGAARLYDASEADVILNGFPLFHVAGSFVYGLSMLLSGAEIVLPPPSGWRDAAFVARAWALMREHRVSVIAMVPTVMSALLAAPRAAGDAAGVRLALTGGSPLPTELAAQFEAATGAPVRNILGMTECAGVIAIEPARAPRTPLSCGLPLPFSTVEADAQGVLRVRGPNVGPGYTDAARNAGSFEGGWLITGDIGRVDDQGRVFVTGRAKDVIIRGAHNIDPGVIEEALLQHPQVALAAAVAEPDEYAGELPVAFVVARPGATLDAAEVLAAAAPHIPERAAVPRRVTVLPALPLTAIGKVYKPALRLMAVERVLRERLDAAGLADQLHLRVEDRSDTLVACFGARDATEVEARLRALMAGFALAWELAR